MTRVHRRCRTSVGFVLTKSSAVRRTLHDLRHVPPQGSSFNDLTCLRELRLSTGDHTSDFEVQLAGLPPTLRRLRLTHGDKCEHVFPRLIIAEPPTISSARGAVCDPHPAPGQATPPAAPSEPAALAVPQLVSLVIDCHSTQLPASLPLPASCAVTVHAALLTLKQVGELPAHVRRDYEKVRSRAHPDI